MQTQTTQGQHSAVARPEGVSPALDADLLDAVDTFRVRECLDRLCRVVGLLSAQRLVSTASGIETTRTMTRLLQPVEHADPRDDVLRPERAASPAQCRGAPTKDVGLARVDSAEFGHRRAVRRVVVPMQFQLSRKLPAACV